jgi:hypothetical protein
MSSILHYMIAELECGFEIIQTCIEQKFQLLLITATTRRTYIISNLIHQPILASSVRAACPSLFLVRDGIIRTHMVYPAFRRPLFPVQWCHSCPRRIFQARNRIGSLVRKRGSALSHGQRAAGMPVTTSAPRPQVSSATHWEDQSTTVPEY